MSSQISPEEKTKRTRAVAVAMASMRLEGFTPDARAQAINERYMNGEISGQEQEALILALVGGAPCQS